VVVASQSDLEQCASFLQILTVPSASLHPITHVAAAAIIDLASPLPLFAAFSSPQNIAIPRLLSVAWSSFLASFISDRIRIFSILMSPFLYSVLPAGIRQ
jgi:hypothetical protein